MDEKAANLRPEDVGEHWVMCRMLPLVYVYLFGGATIGLLYAGLFLGLTIALFFVVPAMCVAIAFVHMTATICPHRRVNPGQPRMTEKE